MRVDSSVLVRKNSQFILQHGLEFVETVSHTPKSWGVGGINELAVVVVVSWKGRN